MLDVNCNLDDDNGTDSPLICISYFSSTWDGFVFSHSLFFPNLFWSCGKMLRSLRPGLCLWSTIKGNWQREDWTCDLASTIAWPNQLRKLRATAFLLRVLLSLLPHNWCLLACDSTQLSPITPTLLIPRGMLAHEALSKIYWVN